MWRTTGLETELLVSLRSPQADAETREGGQFAGYEEEPRVPLRRPMRQARGTSPAKRRQPGKEPGRKPVEAGLSRREAPGILLPQRPTCGRTPKDLTPARVPTRPKDWEIDVAVVRLLMAPPGE